MDNNQFFFAAITALLAIVTIGVNVVNYRLAVKRRKDDLFDRRYKFYKSFDKFWRSTGSEAEGASQMIVEPDDIEAWEIEASFLFGEDIAKHIRSYQGRSFKGQRWVPDADLAKPFRRYLNLR